MIESSYEWYQLVVAYGIGILLIIMWLFFSKEMKDYLGIPRFVLAILLVVSTIIGIFLFGESSDNKQTEEINVWVEIWNMLLASPLDFIASLIVIILLYLIFAVVPFVCIMAGIILYKLYKDYGSLK